MVKKVAWTVERVADLVKLVRDSDLRAADVARRMRVTPRALRGFFQRAGFKLDVGRRGTELAHLWRDDLDPYEVIDEAMRTGGVEDAAAALAKASGTNVSHAAVKWLLACREYHDDRRPMIPGPPKSQHCLYPTSLDPVTYCGHRAVKGSYCAEHLGLLLKPQELEHAAD